MKKHNFFLICPFLWVLALGAWPESAVHAGQARAELERVIAETQAAVFPAVVFIKPIQEEYRIGEKRKVIVYGSGVIIAPEGLVVTNHHVVENAVAIRCVLSDRREVQATLIGQDEETDLALLKLKGEAGAAYPHVAFGDSDALRPGEFVLAMGAPFGFARSVSLGIVSNTRRYLGSSPFNLWIQTDAAINPGNSGGPLVDVSGRIVGINSRGISMADNIGFAIPVNRVKEVMSALRQHGVVRRSWTGLQLQPLKDFEKSMFYPAETGVLVAGVDRHSPAEAAGLKTGDRLLRINGTGLNGLFMEDLPTLRRTLAALPPDRAVRLALVREGKDVTVSLKPVRKGKVVGGNLALKAWGMTIKEISRHEYPELAYFRPVGVHVQGVKYDGNAYAAGFRSGDVLLAIDHDDMTTLDAVKGVYRRLNTLPQGKRLVLCRVLRGGYEVSLPLDFNRLPKAPLSGDAEETRKADF